MPDHTFHVDSEVGRLRQVILHRPDLELKRLTPDNVADLLFDDMLWVSQAQAEHDAFAETLRSRGVVVHYYGVLLAQTLDIAEARAYVLDRLFDPRWHGPMAAATLRAALDGLESAELARYLAGGITKREIAELGPVPKSIAFHSLDPDGFVLAPLPMTSTSPPSTVAGAASAPWYQKSKSAPANIGCQR